MLLLTEGTALSIFKLIEFAKMTPTIATSCLFFLFVKRQICQPQFAKSQPTWSVCFPNAATTHFWGQKPNWLY